MVVRADHCGHIPDSDISGVTCSIYNYCMYSALALLTDVLTEPSQGDVINALTTLANVASHSASHLMVSTAVTLW